MTPTQKPPTWHEIQAAREALREATSEMILIPIPRWTRFWWRVARLVKRDAK